MLHFHLSYASYSVEVWKTYNIFFQDFWNLLSHFSYNKQKWNIKCSIFAYYMRTVLSNFIKLMIVEMKEIRIFTFTFYRLNSFRLVSGYEYFGYKYLCSGHEHLGHKYLCFGHEYYEQSNQYKKRCITKYIMPGL